MERRNAAIILRITKKERRAMSKAAQRLGLSREAWIRLHLERALTEQKDDARSTEAA